VKALTLSLLLSLVAAAYAVPPPPEKKESTINSAEVIAIVTISRVDSSTDKDGITSEVAYLHVEQVLKGTLPEGAKLKNVTSRLFPCHPPTLEQSKGRALVFLCKEGEFYRHGWTQLRPIRDGQVSWYGSSKSEPLTNVVEDIKRIVGTK